MNSLNIDSMVPMSIPLVALGGVTYYFHKKIEAQSKEFNAYRIESEAMIKSLFEELVSLRKQHSILEQTVYEYCLYKKENDDEEEENDEVENDEETEIIDVSEKPASEGIVEEPTIDASSEKIVEETPIDVVSEEKVNEYDFIIPETTDRISEMSDTELDPTFDQDEYISIPTPVANIPMEDSETELDIPDNNDDEEETIIHDNNNDEPEQVRIDEADKTVNNDVFIEVSPPVVEKKKKSITKKPKATKKPKGLKKQVKSQKEPSRTKDNKLMWFKEDENKVWNRKTNRYISSTSAIGKKCLKDLRSEKMI